MYEPALDESKQRVWIVPAGPVVWAVHFTASYVTLAVWCGRWAGVSHELGTAGVLVAAYTVIALVAIAGIGWHGWRAHRHANGSAPHDADTPRDRHRFIGLATLLLAALSAVAVVYSVLGIWLSATCL